MSLSHRSSFETVVVEKVRDDLLFLTKANLFRKELDLKGLSDSASKCFSALKRWPQATVCHDHPLTNSTVNRISDFSDSCYHAVDQTLIIAQKGHLLAANISVFCDAITKKYSSLEHLESLLLKLNTIADKGHGHSVEAHGRLICLRAGLSQISGNIPSVATKIEEDILRSSAQDAYLPANGINTPFVTMPTAVYQAPKGLLAYKGIGAAADSDDEDAIGSSSWGPDRPIFYPRENWYTFQNVSTQLDLIGGDISQMIEHVGRYVEWWGRMKAGLDALKGELAKVMQDGQRSLHMLTGDVTDGWNDIADQFALYVYKTSPTVAGYYPYIGPRVYPPARAWSPPPRPRSPPSPRPWSPAPPMIYNGGVTVLPADSGPADNSQSFWKKLSCIS